MRSHDQEQIDRLQQRVRRLEGLIETLAEHVGVGPAELLELRGRTGPAIPEECRRLVANGEVIGAIKAYREHTGAGLKEAKDAIDQYRDQAH